MPRPFPDRPALKSLSAQSKAAADLLLGEKADNQPSGEDHLRFVLACHLRDLGFSEEQARARLHVWNEHECRYPRDPAEIDKAVTNAYTYARDVPGNRAIPTAHEAFAARIEAEQPEPVPETPLGRMLATLRSYGYRAHGHTADQVDSIPPPSWLVPGYIMTEGFTLLYGPPKNGKSYVALDLALAVVHGKPWLGHVALPVEPGAVLYLALEGMYETLRRAKAWCKHHGVEPSDKLYAISGLRFYDDSINPALKAAIAAIPDLRCIVIDTLARAAVGLDENSARDQGFLVDRLDRLAEDAKVPVIAVHHTGKDVSRGTRGSNALPAAAAGSILVQRRDDGCLALSVTDIRRGSGGRPMILRPIPVETEGEIVWQARPDMEADGAPVPRGSVDAEILRAVVSALCSGVDTEIITESRFLAKVAAHAPAHLDQTVVRRTAERLLDTLPALRERRTAHGVALLQPEDRATLERHLEGHNGEAG